MTGLFSFKISYFNAKLKFAFSKKKYFKKLGLLSLVEFFIISFLGSLSSVQLPFSFINSSFLALLQIILFYLPLFFLSFLKLLYKIYL